MRNKIFNSKPKLSVMKTIKKMTPAVLTALIASALGFIALYTSPVPMIQDFGKMLTVGMVVSFLIAVFVLIPILFTRDQFFSLNKTRNEKKDLKGSRVDHFFRAFTKMIIKIRWLIIILAICTAAVGVWADSYAGVETDVETFMPQETQALKDIHKLREAIGSTDQVSIMFETDSVLSYDTLQWIDGVTESIESNFSETIIQTNSIATVLKQLNEGTLPTETKLEALITNIPKEQLKLLVNEEETKGVIIVGIERLQVEDLKIFIDDLNDYLDLENNDNIKTVITGKAVLDVEMVSALTTGRYKMTLFGMLFVFMGLLVIYRHPVKAFIPLLPIIFIIGWSGGTMFLLDINYTPLTATLGALIIGIGTEFTILIMERYYEEKKKGKDKIDAILMANQKIGKAIFASAITTIGGFSALLVSDFVILSNFGMMTLINITFALFSTLVVMPAILIILDPFVKVKLDKGQEVI